MKLKELKKQWMADPKVKAEYDTHAYEFEVAKALIQARSKAGLTQADVAERMGTTQSAVARIEGGSRLPSMSSVVNYAKAVGAHPVLTLVKD